MTMAPRSWPHEPPLVGRGRLQQTLAQVRLRLAVATRASLFFLGLGFLGSTWVGGSRTQL